MNSRRNLSKLFSVAILVCLCLCTELYAWSWPTDPDGAVRDTGSLSMVSAEENDFIHRWCGFLSQKTETPGSERYTNGIPFSFVCGNRNSREWMSLKDAKINRGEWQKGKRISMLSWTDKATNLSCEMEMTEFLDFPVFEWVIKLKNNGREEIGPVSDFKALDMFWKRNNADLSIPLLLRSYGSDGAFDDFRYICEELRQSMWKAPKVIRMDTKSNGILRELKGSTISADGRPSATWLPFFNLRTGDDGIIIALGWAGQWFSVFSHDGKGTTDITAGMEHLETMLKPGESIRSPRVLIQYWQGEPLHGQNVFRKFLLSRHVPQVDGKPVKTPVCCGTWGGSPTKEHLAMIKRIEEHKLPYDYYWMDAGWYGTSTEPCPNVFKGKWSVVGDWRVNRNYHPDGLRPISEAAHNAGMKFLLWIEPERASYGTPVTLEHPDWFLRRKKGPISENESLLLNLGNPEAWKWAVETVSGLISENGIDCYREDFNIDPSPFWMFTDTVGRKGITEMRFVEGFYAFWDELLRRHPGLLIDNCASGGRRIELETISRSIALWRSDYNCFPDMNPEASQYHGYGLSHWFPTNSISPYTEPGDTYQFRSSLSAGIVFKMEYYTKKSNYKQPDYPWEWHRKMILEARRASRYFYGDFFPLTQGDYLQDSWMVCQYHLTDAEEGMILAFRRPGSGMTEGTFTLKGLSPGKIYEFEEADTGNIVRYSGADIINEGLRILISNQRDSRMLFYRCVKN